MLELGLENTNELQEWFTRRIGAYLTERGRRLVGWDELLEAGADTDAIISSWRGDEHAIEAASRGHEVVACPSHTVYFDYRQSSSSAEPTAVGSVSTLADVYAFDPIPPGMPEALHAKVIGGQGNAWTEHMRSPRRIDYLVFPRLCALADAVWRSGEPDFAAFEHAMATHLQRLEALGVEFRPLDGPHPWQLDDSTQAAKLLAVGATTG
jgi:hexosaminidase